MTRKVKLKDLEGTVSSKTTVKVNLQLNWLQAFESYDESVYKWVELCYLTINNHNMVEFNTIEYGPSRVGLINSDMEVEVDAIGFLSTTKIRVGAEKRQTIGGITID